MYDSSDPRSRLTQKTAPPLGTEGIAAPETHLFRDPNAADTSVPGTRVWAARGQNFLVEYIELDAGSELEFNRDRGCVLIVEDGPGEINVAVSKESAALDERGIIIVPPGPARVSASEQSIVVAVSDIMADGAPQAANAESYAQAHPRVARLAEDLPAPNALKAYPLSDYPPENGRFGTIFRTHTLMINFLDDQIGPRDPEKLSPHHHDDFEQGSLTLSGAWKHHIRTPWTTKQSQWRDDVHVDVEGPSLTIIPPPTVHTSRAVGEGLNLMIDLFSPPRDDFADNGWVVNAEDFPR
ncbi:hypothetical protein QYM46_02175 [Brevibacterium sp. K11IcPPYGO002]|uniref:hypothetical protein n=1 Tax=Brevibacterium sp. K11IcPPYGO002 TaxID=3058837 RepID=UPI003D818481